MGPKRIDLSGRVVAVTGAGRGIGRATAIELVRRGARVALGDIDLEAARDAAAAAGGESVALALDTTVRESFERFLTDTEAAQGPLDGLVNNAGIAPLRAFASEPDEVTRATVQTNLVGVMLGTKVALELMLPRRRGHIVNMASSAGRVGAAGLATYSATKHGVVGLTEALAGELRGRGVRFSVVMPGLVTTEMISGTRPLRGVGAVAPEEVAAAIAGCLERPRFAVYVPRSVGAVARATALLPHGAAEALKRAVGVHRTFAEADHGQRVEYERRAAEAWRE